MVANVGYVKARQILFSKKQIENLNCYSYTSVRRLMAGLRKLGVERDRLRKRKNERYRSFKFDAVLAVDMKPGGLPTGDFHWVVWDSTRKKVLDPDTPKYRRYKMSHFLSVKRPN
jgi:hypothetical protein